MKLVKILHKQVNSVMSAAFLVALFSLASRFLGIFRDRILAGKFGAGSELDIYYAAFRIPDLIFNLLILGALSAGFVPIFTSLIKNFSSSGPAKQREENNSEAWFLVNNVLGFLVLGVGIISILGIIFAQPLTRLITPGFSPEQQVAVARLTRIMFLSPLFLGLSGVFSGILQSFKRFLVYSLSPIFYNLGIIVGALYFTDRWGLRGLAWGVVLGAFLHFLVQVPIAYQLGYRYRPLLVWRDKNTLTIWRMMIPRTLSLAVSQVNLVVITILASGLASGSLAIFNLANNLQSFPIGIFGISFAVAAFPALSLVAFDLEKLSANFSQTVRQIFFFVIPATVLMIIFRAQIVRVVLGAGSFDWEDTILTMNTLGFFTLSLFAQATLPLLTRVFYARQDSRTPFYFSVIAVVLNIILSIYLGPKMGVVGLALAFSITSILNFLFLWIAICVKIGNLDISNILQSVLKFTFSAIVAGLVAQEMKAIIWPFIDMTKFSGVFTQLTVSASLGIIVYFFLCYLLKSPEARDLLLALRKRLPFHKIKVEDQTEARGI